jgi:biopolymer transport protein ExbB
MGFLLQVDTAKLVTTLRNSTNNDLWSLLNKGGLDHVSFVCLAGGSIFVFFERLIAIRKASRIDVNFMNIVRGSISLQVM